MSERTEQAGRRESVPPHLHQTGRGAMQTLVQDLDAPEGVEEDSEEYPGYDQD
ncbi:hypothetical protein [Desulfuromonas sp. TF]|uniref:hypothetical protein n=1 Tax=Desulfuromonas sp. TF TaxID=1232410 RepID=UPI000405AE5E|nr:hypothetical protein [Desulfuromonas sp. TF]